MVKNTSELWYSYLMYAMAFDLGTTTIAGYLVDVLNQRTIKAVSYENPQVLYGKDILSRVTYQTESKDNRKTLCDILADTIIMISKQLCDEYLSGISCEDLDCLTMVGNPVILGSIAGYDFSSVFKKANIIIPDSIGGYVGADALLCAYMAQKIYDDKSMLVIDIGTNSEIMLLSQSYMGATSAAAGPALEGGNISCGMSAVNGAIDKIEMTTAVNGETDIITHAIGEGIPQGICGSGLIDLLSCLIECNVVDQTGYMLSKTEALYQHCPNKIAGRIIEKESQNGDSKNIRYFCLTEQIMISQEDIRNLQLAISAIRSGMEILILQSGLTNQVTDRIVLAGAFGNNISITNSITCGLLPKDMKNKIVQSGNLAGKGACFLAMNPELIADVITLKNRVLTVSLESIPEFKDLFMKNMVFS